MIASSKHPTAVIGAFDDRANIERVYLHSKSPYPCYYDSGISEKKFGVRYLPFEYSYQGTN